jgi:hypothetical protein
VSNIVTWNIPGEAKQPGHMRRIGMSNFTELGPRVLVSTATSMVNDNQALTPLTLVLHVKSHVLSGADAIIGSVFPQTYS